MRVCTWAAGISSCRPGQSHVHWVDVWESGYTDGTDGEEITQGSCDVEAPGSGARGFLRPRSGAGQE